MSDFALAYHLVALAEAAPLTNWQPRPNVIVCYIMAIRDGVRVVVRVDNEYRQWQVTISEATGWEPRDPETDLLRAWSAGCVAPGVLYPRLMDRPGSGLGNLLRMKRGWDGWRKQGSVCARARRARGALDRRGACRRAASRKVARAPLIIDTILVSRGVVMTRAFFPCYAFSHMACKPVGTTF